MGQLAADRRTGRKRRPLDKRGGGGSHTDWKKTGQRVWTNQRTGAKVKIVGGKGLWQVYYYRGGDKKVDPLGREYVRSGPPHFNLRDAKRYTKRVHRVNLQIT